MTDWPPLTPATIATSEPSSFRSRFWFDPSATGSTITGINNIVTITTDITLTVNNTIILCDCTGGPINVSVLTAVNNTGRWFSIKKIDSTNNPVTIDPSGSQTIDNGLTAVLTVQGEAIGIISDNANYHIFMAYQPHPSVTQGGQVKSVVTDGDAQQLLQFVLIELQKLNTQLALMTDTTLGPTDHIEEH